MTKEITGWEEEYEKLIDSLPAKVGETPRGLVQNFIAHQIASAVEAMKVDRDDSWRAYLQKLAWKKEEIDDATGWVDRTPLRLRSNHELESIINPSKE